MQLVSRAAALAMISSVCLLGDVSYKETVRFTGGSIVEMMHNMANSPIGKLAGGKIATAMQDQTYRVYVKGAKMARLGSLTSTIIDMDAGTVTSIDHQKRNYTVMTFEEMEQEMSRAQSRMSRGQASDMKFDVKVDPTGRTQTIDGHEAKEYITTVTATQPSGSGSQGNGVMTVHSDTWVASDVPGGTELHDFYMRSAHKYSGAFANLGPMAGGASKGLTASMSEMMKLNGVPLLSKVDVTGVNSPASSMAAFGGANSNSDPNAPFLKMETDSSQFSDSSVDDEKFAIPAGYKQSSRKH